MYLVDIYDAKKNTTAGPNYWVSSETNITLKKAIKMAEDWVSSSKDPSRYKVSWRIVCCL
jgi:hypothetical protein